MAKPNLGKSLGESAKFARSKSASNPVTPSIGQTEVLNLTRLEQGTDEKPGLRAIFAKPRGGTNEIDLGFMKPFKNLAAPISEAYLRWGRDKEAGTQIETAKMLKQGIFRFLQSYSPDVSLCDIDETMVAAYIRWLDSGNTSRVGGVTHPTTRLVYVSSVRKLLKHLISSAWGDEALRILESFPERPYPHADKKSTPREGITRAHLEAIDEAAQREVKIISERMEEGRRLIREGRVKIDQGRKDYSDLATHLAEITKRYPHTLPNYKQLKIEAPDLYEWAYRSNKRNNGFGMVQLGSYLYSSPRELVPFALLLAIEGAFNVESVLELRLQQIEVVERLGVPAVRLNPTKNRGKKNPVKYLDPSWVLPWFEALDHLTSRLRSTLPASEQSKLFVYAQRWGEARAAKTFGKNDSRDGKTLWTEALKCFIDDNQLKPFRMSQIRVGEADELGQAHGSLVVSQALNHTSFGVTEASYVSSGTRAREGEALSLIVEEMKRWVASKGAIDTRRSSRTPSMDRGSATPGYNCANPYDSPRPGQRKNSLCGAYGECPSCELTSVNLEDPLSVAYYVALREAILEGAESMSSEAWVQKWRSVLCDLQAQIDLVPHDVLEKSQAYGVRLPVVG